MEATCQGWQTAAQKRVGPWRPREARVGPDLGSGHPRTKLGMPRGSWSRPEPGAEGDARDRTGKGEAEGRTMALLTGGSSKDRRGAKY